MRCDLWYGPGEREKMLRDAEQLKRSNGVFHLSVTEGGEMDPRFARLTVHLRPGIHAVPEPVKKLLISRQSAMEHVFPSIPSLWERLLENHLGI